MTSRPPERMQHPGLQNWRKAAERAVAVLAEVHGQRWGWLAVKESVIQDIKCKMGHAQELLNQGLSDDAAGEWCEICEDCHQALIAGRRGFGRLLVRSRYHREVAKLLKRSRRAERENRNPLTESTTGPWLNTVFDPLWYLEQNPDVAAAGINPLRHFLESGWKEGRAPRPLIDQEESLQPDPASADTEETEAQSIPGPSESWAVSVRPLQEQWPGKKRVLFVGHDASRTGAPIMLLHLLRWLRVNTEIDFDLLLRWDGPLIVEYAAVCSVFVAPPAEQAIECSSLLSALAGRDIGLIYSNTVTNGIVLQWLSQLNCPVVCHAHEVESYFMAMDPHEIDLLRSSATTFIAASNRIFDSLVQSGVASEKVTVVAGFVPFKAISMCDPERRCSFRREHQIPENALVVGGCGTIHWQKGPDLFLQIAYRLAQRTDLRPLHFVWVGENRGPNAASFLWDIERANLKGCFTLIPGLADTNGYFDSLDIFALTSRNDPLPMVVMEAGARGLPIVCFSGNAELVNNDCGVVVPYLDLETFAQSIRDLATDSARRVYLGEQLARKIAAGHDVSVAAPKIVAIITPFLELDDSTLPALKPDCAMGSAQATAI